MHIKKNRNKIFIPIISALFIFSSIYILFEFRLINPDNCFLFNYFLESEFFHKPDTIIAEGKIPLVNGKKETCLVCHSDMLGLSASHKSDSIGCHTCHLGNRTSLVKEIAHKNMTLTPGNLTVVNKTCGKTDCHAGISERIKSSLMNTMSGVISVDKFCFGEIQNPTGLFNIKRLNYSDADLHLRQLCGSCHLGNDKDSPEQITELSRGGGCSACHIKYCNLALFDLNNRKNKKTSNHPTISTSIDNSNCFGCHSRSGRISTNYEGWHELEENSAFKHQADNINFRKLDDGRIFKKINSDVHFTCGMQCNDCHTSYEIMGDGNKYNHKEEAIKISCIDCHTKKPKFINYDSIDIESKKIVDLNYSELSGKQFILTEKTSEPIISTVIQNNKVYTCLKNNGKKLEARPPSKNCGINIEGHYRLSCISCHNSWSPQCYGCHTNFMKNEISYDHISKKEVNGSWNETGSNYIAGQSAMGIVHFNGKDEVYSFIPGMNLTIQKDRKIINKRLFAPAFSHTVTKKTVSCKGCHNQSSAIGYGSGTLEYSTKSGKGKWSFKAEKQKTIYDNIAEDALIDFETGKSGQTTRINTRAFNQDEQKNILRVGSCFVCHSESEKKLLKVLKKKNYTKLLSRSCIISQ